MGLGFGEEIKSICMAERVQRLCVKFNKVAEKVVGNGSHTQGTEQRNMDRQGEWAVMVKELKITEKKMDELFIAFLILSASHHPHFN